MQPSLKKVTPLFLTNPPLKIKVLSSPLFLKIWQEVQPPLQKGGGGGGAHYATANSISGCHNPIGVKLLTRLQFRLSQLHQHKFKHSFHDTLNQYCSFRKEVETTSHFLLSCHNYSDKRSTLLSKTGNINPNILKNATSQITQFILYRDKDFTANFTSINFIILKLVSVIFLTNFYFFTKC